MAYMRNQHDMSFNNDFSQRGFKPQGGPPTAQRSQASNSYWSAVGGLGDSNSQQESYGEYDYGYGENYGEENYNQGVGGGGGDGGFQYGYEENYEGEWQGEGDGSGNQWSGDQGASVGIGRGMEAFGGRGGGNMWSEGVGSDRGWGESQGTGFLMGGSFGVGRGGVNKDAFVSNKGAGRWEGDGRGGDGFDRGGKAGGRGGGKAGSSVSSQSTSAAKPEKPVKKPVVAEVFSPDTPISVLLEKWKSFAKEFADCGNAISNMECSLKASKVSLLHLEFDCKFITKCNNYNIFSGTLHVSKMVNNVAKETVFLARGQGLNKKSAKLDCYEKAYNLLKNDTVQAMMSQENFSDKVIKQEIHQYFRENPKDFLNFVKGSASNDDSDQETKGHKRGGSSRSGGSESKRPRLPDYEPAENKNMSLAPTKKIELLMHPDDPLIEKLYTLKQLLKEEGITRLHIVPKIDQLAQRCAVHIQNVYRFEETPVIGFDTRMPVYCEIYFDDVLMARGPADFNDSVAMQLAYSNLATRLYAKPLEDIVNSKVWHPFMALDVDMCTVVTKWHGMDNDSLLTSNLTNMKQMMQSMPDVTIPIEKMVLTEHESDQNIENVFKSLELSATRNLMLLECEITRNKDMTFTCILSLQGRELASRKHPTKNGAKRLASEAVMNEMKKSHDVIYVKTELVGRVVTKGELLLLAAKKKALGEPPGKIFRKIAADSREEYERLSPEERRRREIERKKYEERENLPENINARPLLPWLAAAMYDILDQFYQNITLEDLMLDVGEMPKSQRDIVSSCTAKMGLRMVTKAKTSFDGPILRRTVTAQDMTKILQLHGGESGRYKLISCKNPLSGEELEFFRDECMEQHRKLVEARINDNPDDDDPEFMGAAAEYSSPSSSNNPYPQYAGSPPSSKPQTDPHWGGSQVFQPPSVAALAHMARTPVVYPGLRRFTEAPKPLMGSGIRPLLDPYYGNRY